MATTAYRVRNWKHYNKSLTSRGSITFWFSEDAIKNWNKSIPTEKKGRPQYYNNIAILTALILRQLFRLPLRQTQGLVQSLLQLMHLSCSSPNYTTLSRRASSLQLDIGLEHSKEPKHVLVDSTGVRVVGEGEWKVRKHGMSRYQVWKKLHIVMDASNQNILSATMTDSKNLDGNYLSDLLDQIDDPILSVTGDGGYDKKNCYRAVYKRKAQAIIPVQKNAIVQRNKYKKDAALVTRDNLIRLIGEDEYRPVRLKEWKISNNYHKRSLVETMMFRMKSVFGDEIRSKKPENQYVDLMVRCRVMNQINSLGLPISKKIVQVTD